MALRYGILRAVDVWDADSSIVLPIDSAGIETVSLANLMPTLYPDLRRAVSW